MSHSEDERRPVALFDASYGNFETDVQAAVRRGAFGEDIGQNSWLTADEWRRYLGLLELSRTSDLLEVASGGGGPAICAAVETGCRVTGVDQHAKGVATGNKLATDRGLAERVRFVEHDASQRLPFADGSFDAVTCIDSIHHFPDRRAVLAEWRRLLRPGGRILYTDPILVTGILSNEEIFVRSSIGFFLFTPVGINEQLLEQAGFDLVQKEDATDNMATVARRWRETRAETREGLLRLEGAETFEGQQRFFQVTSMVAAERRLSRFTFLARATRG
jgi:SAM-dependent methyltransferase